MKKLLCLLLLCCTACSSTPPARQDFLLQASRTGSAQSVRFGALQVQELRAAPPFRDSALVYRETAQRFVADPYHGFLAPPPVQLSQNLRQWLRSSGLFAQVLPSAGSAASSWLLEGELLALYIDVSDPAQPAAVLELQLQLHRGTQSFSYPLAIREALASAEPEAAAAGLQRALSRALTQLEQQLTSSKAD
ncbi:ABC-type transport auxiliary lipoprotein family protein [Chitinibacter tainanensis]|uniref:ABC-type transport auxiliary lipoprotein family protein n=1 Tax=Chitinibacter tainanensis TaxID=230667 RepID=UPI002356CD36|nr:ABC-type transport auxiliary lipoprotein family protein [Chitinibacter tainanensis]